MADIATAPSSIKTTRFGKKRKTGVLFVGQHTLLKQVHNCVSGRREVDFYNTVFQRRHSDDSDDITSLRPFLPRFMGVEEIAGVRHIKLENIKSKFRKPCMIDIKMGHVTSDPYAEPEKVEQRRCKYPYAEKLGFSLSGMTVHNPVKGEYEDVDKYTCHSFTPSQVIVDGLGKFLGFPSNPRKDVIRCLLHKLHTIRRWFLRQRQFHFYASSLLIVYEGLVQDGDHHHSIGSDADQECKQTSACSCPRVNDDIPDSETYCDSSQPLNGTCTYHLKENQTNCECSFSEFPWSDSRCRCIKDSSSPCCSLVDVRLIDFTHALPASERDDNYLSGLQILIKILHLMYSWC